MNNIKIVIAVMLLSANLYGAPSAPKQMKKAIVIGASTGIGKEVAKVLAKNGYEVGLCSRKIDLLNALQKEIPTKTYVKQIDLIEVDTVQDKLKELTEEMGGLDLMIVNSGVWPEENNQLYDNKYMPFDSIYKTIQVNVTGCAAAFTFANNFFVMQNYGHIVGISSVDAVRGNSLAPAYCASKAFMATFLEGLRNRFAQQGIPIAVTEIRPGCIKTDNTSKDNNYTYWVVPATVAADDIYNAIQNKSKIAYVPKRWKLIAFLLKIVPDWVYNKMGGF